MNDLLNKHHIVIPAQRSGHYIEVAAQRSAAQRSGNINPAQRSAARREKFQRLQTLSLV